MHCDIGALLRGTPALRSQATVYPEGTRLMEPQITEPVQTYDRSQPTVGNFPEIVEKLS